ncbi:DUF2306 domain-containing protein [Endozoicomonadaceae bacterium StTr2]
MEFFYSSPLGALHSLSALVALIAGAIVFQKRKGTGQHKKVGYIYIASMLTLNLSALFLQNMTGGFSWFHLFILMSLPYLLIGMYYPIFARQKNERWHIYHFEYLSFSYVGLLAAFVAEVIIRVPLAAGVSSLNQFIVGIFVVAGMVGFVGDRVIKYYRTKLFG